MTEFLCVSEAAPGTVEAIISPPRDDVHVVMPDVLVSVGLVVLTRGDAVASECRLHGYGRRANGSLNWRAEFDREVVDVFEVIVRDDEHRARVPRPPLRVHLHEDVVVAMKELEWEVRRPCCQISTEGTVVAGRLVVVHAVIFVDGPRAYAPKGNPLVVQERPDPPRLCSARLGPHCSALLPASAGLRSGRYAWVVGEHLAGYRTGRNLSAS